MRGARRFHGIFKVDDKPVHIFVAYGFANSSSDVRVMARTVSLSRAIFGEMYVVAPGAPTILMGDFNVEIREISVLWEGSPLGDLRDLAEALPGGDFSPTCYASVNSKGNKRDFIMASPSLFPALAQHSVRGAGSFPTHRVVDVVRSASALKVMGFSATIPCAVRITDLQNDEDQRDKDKIKAIE